MFAGLLLFAIAGLLVVAIYVAMRVRRERYEADLPDEDRLSDEEFRHVEFGDED